MVTGNTLYLGNWAWIVVIPASEARLPAGRQVGNHSEKILGKPE